MTLNSLLMKPHPMKESGNSLELIGTEDKNLNRTPLAQVPRSTITGTSGN